MWHHIVIEGYCFANVEQPSKERPCRRRVISTFCLLNGMCPHFSYCDSSEREAALFAPLWGIIRDRIKYGVEKLYWKLRWYFWDKWFFKPPEYETGECPAWDEQLRQNKANFSEWLKEARKEAKKYSTENDRR